MTPDERRTAAERAALNRYCPVHRVGPGRLCVLLDAGDYVEGSAVVTTGICSTRMSGRLEGPR